MGSLAIGEVARRAGVNATAIRYWERAGVLPPPRRVGGQRRYDSGVLDHLAAIRMAQGAGFTVAEVRELVHGGEPGSPFSARWRALAERKLNEVAALIARARAMQAVLEEGLRCGCLTLDDCALVARESCGRSDGSTAPSRPGSP